MKNTKSLIAGNRIYLRRIKISDVKRNYCAWMNDPEVVRYTESRFKKWQIQALKNYVRAISRNPGSVMLAMILKDKDTHIGNIKIGPIDYKHKFADIGIIIGEKSLWGKGFAVEALKLAIKYAFNRLKIHKLTAGIYANNTGSLRAFKKAGFITEGLLKKQYVYKASYVDAVLLGIRRK